jgi:hypothetical protein
MSESRKRVSSLGQQIELFHDHRLTIPNIAPLAARI